MHSHKIFFYIGFLLSSSYVNGATQSKCDQIPVKGYCTSEVKEAKDVCRDKESGEDIAGKYAELKNTKLTRDTNLGALSAKYRDLEKSSKSEAQNKKACYQVATALREDCVDRCKQAKESVDCDSSLDSIDEVRKYCKKSEEAAEEMAAIAAENAETFGGPPLDFGSSSSFSSNSNSSSGNPLNPGSVSVPAGYTGAGVGTNLPKINGDGSENMADAIAKGLAAGSNSGAGSGGSGSSGATLGSSGAGALQGVGSKTGAADGVGVGGGDANASNRGSGGSGSGTSAVSGKSEVVPGYMIWGAPARKKKAPLTLLPPKEKSSSSSSASSQQKNKDASVKVQTRSPVPK